MTSGPGTAHLAWRSFPIGAWPALTMTNLSKDIRSRAYNCMHISILQCRLRNRELRAKASGAPHTVSAHLAPF
jgi:hypothetical protein